MTHLHSCKCGNVCLRCNTSTATCINSDISYIIKSSFNKHIIYHGNDEKVEKHIPLLKACGIAGLIDALDVFLSFEEYFSLEKTASERRDPIGSTNDDKITSHGFDTKISFRGKSK